MARKKEKEESKSLDSTQDLPTILYKIFTNDGENEFTEVPRWFLPSGNLALDYILSGKVDGSGGYPSGIVEVHGDPATGKSLLFAKAIGNAQKMGMVTILADAEGRWDYDFAALHGVNAELLRKQTFYPETVEDFAVKSMEIIQKVGKVVLILDSIGILSTVQERNDVEGGDMKADQGRKAQKVKAAMRVLSTEIRKTGSLFMISNHVIAQPGSYIPTKVTPGGGGVPFQANVRLELTRPTPIKLEKKEHPIGVQLHLECTKNSVIAPFGSCDLDMFFSSGVNPYSGLVAIAKDIGVIVSKGAYLYYVDKSFYAKDFGTICESTDILKDPLWDKPYWK